MNKYLPTLLAILAGVMPSISTDVQNAIITFVTHNPIVASWMTVVLWVIYHFVPSPWQQAITSPTPPKV